MGEVVTLGVETTLPIPVSRILDDAAGLTEVMVLGWTADGQLYLAASEADLGGHLILIERAKRLLMDRSSA